MCFHSKQSKSAQELKHRFMAHIKDDNLIQPTVYNGFQYPQTPVITNKLPNEIQLYAWGLIPFWAKDNSIRKNTLNAKIETIHQKPSFRNVVNNRCLVLADGFYEWQWLDPKGKQKQKYELTLPNHEAFAFAGLWSEWIDKSTGNIIYTYTILTTEANELMSQIHNTQKRMPIILSPESEQDWLRGENLIMQNNRILATEA
ncbi:MAG: SOS response-associated peptidase [Bacteroidetes bacterium]|nr:SOS response-associated peptidase [Bacteroidota bacterium]